MNSHADLDSYISVRIDTLQQEDAALDLSSLDMNISEQMQLLDDDGPFSSNALLFDPAFQLIGGGSNIIEQTTELLTVIEDLPILDGLPIVDGLPIIDGLPLDESGGVDLGDLLDLL
tara:strand:- start:467 stop:817 length:351 start_codon:yes stop_codon:yes gene_type:complete